MKNGIHCPICDLPTVPDHMGLTSHCPGHRMGPIAISLIEGPTDCAIKLERGDKSVILGIDTPAWFVAGECLPPYVSVGEITTITVGTPTYDILEHCLDGRVPGGEPL